MRRLFCVLRTCVDRRVLIASAVAALLAVAAALVLRQSIGFARVSGTTGVASVLGLLACALPCAVPLLLVRARSRSARPHAATLPSC